MSKRKLKFECGECKNKSAIRIKSHTNKFYKCKKCDRVHFRIGLKFHPTGMRVGKENKLIGVDVGIFM